MRISSLLFVLGILFLQNCHNAEGQDDTRIIVNKLTIRAVNFSTMTALNVDCDKFERYFKNQYKQVVITDSDKIKQFLKIVSASVPIDSTYSRSVDTRAKIELNTQSDTSFICVGHLSFFDKGRYYKTPRLLIDFIESALK